MFKVCFRKVLCLGVALVSCAFGGFCYAENWYCIKVRLATHEDRVQSLKYLENATPESERKRLALEVLQGNKSAIEALEKKKLEIEKIKNKNFVVEVLKMYPSYFPDIVFSHPVDNSVVNNTILKRFDDTESEVVVSVPSFFKEDLKEKLWGRSARGVSLDDKSRILLQLFDSFGGYFF